MAEVRDELVPMNGLTDAVIRFAGMDHQPRGAIFRFDFVSHGGDTIGTFRIPVGPQSDERIDSMVIEAHRQMRDVLRDWLYNVDRSCVGLETRAARWSQSGTAE